MKNPMTGQMREAPVGFSWTVFFFNCLPALFRRDWGGFLIMLVISCLTLGLSGLVFMFIYNKMHLKGLIKDGYKATSASADIDWIEQRIGVRIPRDTAAAHAPAPAVMA
ncbi:hypothetical protein OE699_01875 [Sedimentimonas flavescens]|uniref:Uncharacterized protein n=1 Tax=Sedimentimonas flavescens TaxID=2851012 RepID=A0ABT2ZV13_9RHOB|nr:hypothetical protein [Sedimentimonas flavescens]MCV2877587.1 hypothetical protein [Sedimentimonas flavescens]